MRFLIFLFIIFFNLVHGYFPVKPSKELDKNAIKFFSGSSNPDLSKEVANILGINISKAKIKKYSDGEINIRLEESIRGKDVYILQSICSSKNNNVNDNLMELYFFIRNCKKSSAKSITAVIPYFGYSRQDGRTKNKEPIAASDVAMLLELAGVDHIITLDLHCGQIKGFFHKIAVDNLNTNIVFAPYFERQNLKEMVVVTPDIASLPRTQHINAGFQKFGMETSISLLVRYKLKSDVFDKLYLIGEVSNKDVIIIDDICDTADTLVESTDELKKRGANKIYGCVTHPVFSDNAIEKLEKSNMHMLYVTNTITINKTLPPKIMQISIAPLIAESIKRCQNGDPISHLYEGHQ